MSNSRMVLSFASNKGQAFFSAICSFEGLEKPVAYSASLAVLTFAGGSNSSPLRLGAYHSFAIRADDTERQPGEQVTQEVFIKLLMRMLCGQYSQPCLRPDRS